MAEHSFSGDDNKIVDFTNVHAAVDYLRGYGLLAPLVAFILFAIQAALPVFPYFILAGAAGIIFGFWEGFFLSWSGALAGACFAFYMVRLTGWEWLHIRLKRWFKHDLREVTPFLGFWGIVIARIFPVVPTPLINFVGGISGISAWIFISASAIGKIPTAIIYTGLGNRMVATEDIYTTLALLVAICIVGYIGMRMVQKRFWQR
ncbi:MAG: TVP38/TMEM64 family protein [Syntrophomonadales bacterium]|jgi:uncharacterized membrane protein YdjX (TVP38/TMEM64 family)